MIILDYLHNISIFWKHLHKPSTWWMWVICLCGSPPPFFSIFNIFIGIWEYKRQEGHICLFLRGEGRGEGLHMCMPGNLILCEREQQSCTLERGHEQCHNIFKQRLLSYRTNNFRLGMLPLKKMVANLSSQEHVCVYTCAIHSASG